MSDHPVDTFAERLAAAFDAAGLSVADVARECKVSVQAVYKWLRGTTADIEGAHLVTVAQITKHNPAWLEFGMPPRAMVYATSENGINILRAMENLNEQQAFALAQMAAALADSAQRTKPT